ncbi:hypothetical protein H5A20_13615 [Pectobacterium brasiliense]|uniref:hypothetical protein n=1 Tax=Pectobacterium brasiliense TaxID=180957 RepID=UPI0019697581|nr:hypothetical protein [Pectobacterium brasiliense]MBN3199742.1 hypothetical protein [Pectobacterium brasiliense]
MDWQAFWSRITALIARIALLSWRKQGQLKVKLAFKKAIADYANQLKKIASYRQSPPEDQMKKL